VLERLRRPDGGLYRTARAGKAHLDAYLEDYAYLSDALIDLHEAGGSADFLASAGELAERMLADFADAEGGAFYFTARTHEALLVRTREGHDGAIPNPNAVAARALARLSFHLDREPLRDKARQALEAYGRAMQRVPRAFATALNALGFLTAAPVELVFAGSRGDPRLDALEAEVGRQHLPNRIIGYADPDRRQPAASPLLAGKALVAGAPALYVCQNFACQTPVSDPSAVANALDAPRAGDRETRG